MPYKFGILACLILFMVQGCQQSGSNPENSYPTQEAWKTYDRSEWPQILLTNDYEFKGGPYRASLGASAFLIETSRKDTFMCTAKHLLGEDMGVFPPVPPDSINELLNYWQLFPRTDQLSSDTLSAERYIGKGQDDHDLILLDVRPQKHTVQPLRPRMKQVKTLEQLILIGCPYSMEDCHQWTYSLEVEKVVKGSIYAHCDQPINLSGFSGAPVVDQWGFVVGVLRGAIDKKYGITVVIEPIWALKEWL